MIIRYLFCVLVCVGLSTGALAAPDSTSVKTERITIDPKPAGKSEASDVPAPEAGGDTTTPDKAPETTSDNTAEAEPDDEPVPTIHYGETDLPAPVARMRDALLEAARSGNVEDMRVVLEMNEVMPTLSFGEIADPIEFLKQSSGDGEGREVLAILLEVLQAGWVHIEAGKPQEMYVWPYFAQYPLDKLTPPQLVELFEIVTAYDYKEMQTYGAYIFYRVGIGPDGTLHYFVAGD